MAWLRAVTTASGGGRGADHVVQAPWFAPSSRVSISRTMIPRGEQPPALTAKPVKSPPPKASHHLGRRVPGLPDSQLIPGRGPCGDGPAYPLTTTSFINAGGTTAGYDRTVSLSMVCGPMCCTPEKSAPIGAQRRGAPRPDDRVRRSSASSRFQPVITPRIAEGSSTRGHVRRWTPRCVRLPARASGPEGSLPSRSPHKYRGWPCAPSNGIAEWEADLVNVAAATFPEGLMPRCYAASRTIRGGHGT